MSATQIWILCTTVLSMFLIASVVVNFKLSKRNKILNKDVIKFSHEYTKIQEKSYYWRDAYHMASSKPTEVHRYLLDIFMVYRQKGLHKDLKTVIEKASKLTDVTKKKNVPSE